MKKLLLVLVVAAVMMSNVSAAAFMKLGDIKGESTDREHEDWIVIESFGHAIHQPGGSATGQSRRRGSVILDDIQVSKELDKSSPKIQEAIVTGKVIPKVEIEQTASYGGARQTYLKYELKNVMVTSYSMSTSGSDEQLPSESLSLNYEEIQVSYTQYDSEGGSLGIVEWFHDLMRNR